MYNKVQDFFEDWDYESQATLKLLDNLTDESLKRKVDPDGRTLGYLAWHITLTLGEMMNRTGLTVTSYPADSDAPVSAAEIRKAYADSSSSLVDEIKQKWNDSSLDTEDDMYGTMWTKGSSLSALISHQTHHRGQMTVLMRQAGLKVPGVYGPAREEWVQFGMPAPK